QLARPAAAQVFLGAAEQFGADPAAAVGGVYAQGADDPGRGVGALAGGVGAEAGVGEADGPAVGEGQDQAGGVEVGLGEGEVFQQGGAAEVGGPAADEALVPEVDQGGRVAVAEGAVLDHGSAFPCPGGQGAASRPAAGRAPRRSTDYKAPPG